MTSQQQNLDIMLDENISWDSLRYLQVQHCNGSTPSSSLAQKLIFPNDTTIAICLLLFLIMKRHVQHYLLSLFLIMTKIVPVGLPLGVRQPSTTLASTTPTTSSSGRPKRHRSVSDERGDDDFSGGGGGFKRRRSLVYHADREQCLPCVLWQQSGSDPNLQHLHPLKKSRHVGLEVLSFMEYAAYDDTSFHLSSDDCICKPCYADFQRYKQDKENRCIPRWARVKRQYYATSNKHCIYCCGAGCTCGNIHQWGPDSWHGENTTIGTWKKYLTLTGRIDHAIPDNANHICRVHYRRIYEQKELRSCSVCNAGDSSSWILVCDVAPTPEHMETTFQLESGSMQFFAWVCQQCTLCYRNNSELEAQIANDVQSPDPMTSKKSKLLLDTLELLKTDGVVFTKDVMSQYKLALDNLNVPQDKHSRLCHSFGIYLDSLIKHHQYEVFSVSANWCGRAIYDKQKFNSHSLQYIFKLKADLQWKKSLAIVEHLQNLIRKQITAFPSSKEFDYTLLISNETQLMELNQYFIPELYNLIEKATRSKNSDKHPSSPMYKQLRANRIHMTIGLLCFTLNPQCCFMQTLTGLLCYAYGLRDKGFKALNAIGCCSSIDHIRMHGTFWASRSNPLQYLDLSRSWRLTLDNLNFYMKFAKNLLESGSNKMLNLLTCQVSHSESNPTAIQASMTLKQLVLQSMCKSVEAQMTPLQKSSVELQHFSIRSGTNESYYFQHFLAVCHECSVNRLTLPPTSYSSTFLEAIQSFMPHWTPCSGDNVVYATIEEASSGSITDVAAYLCKVQQDLKIGQSNFPAKVPIAGDQQTYALMKKLQKQDPDKYSWMVVMHGDWHMLQLLAEMMRDLLWDGGFKQMCANCGYKKMPTQWQEIHILLLALHQALLHKAVIVFNSTNDANARDHKQFWSWVSKVASEENRDEISQFWAGILHLISGYVGYFVAIRSGNWMMRNSSIQILTPLFFSYNHWKYEELATEAIIDALTMPEDMLSLFLKGEWTVSAKGKPHHNLALDEAHESMINLRLKTITSRPSHFRTVELSNFMSYLDIVVRGYEGLLYSHRQNEPVQYRKRFICQRATKIQQQLQEVALFEEVEERSLRNILCLERPLDSKSIEDLLSIVSIGTLRMEVFVQENVIPSPNREQGKKNKKRPRKLATFSSRPSSTSEGKKREEELTNIAKNAMELLQVNGITAQTSPYPLAISDIDGNLRSSSKSKFLDTMIKCLNFQQAISSTFSFSVSKLCTIIDMLYFIHIPPPLTVLTFTDYFEYLWGLTVGKYALNKNAAHIYLIFDKPDHLPPPRSMVHKSRGKKNKQDSLDPIIRDDAAIPHGKLYSSLLANSASFKKCLIEYMTSHYRDKCTEKTREYDFSVTIDSPSLSAVITLYDGKCENSAANQHGEADYAMWHHCIRETSTNFLIVSSDTDTWVYGLGLSELGHLNGKQVTIQRGTMQSYIDIRVAATLVSQHQHLRHLSFPVLSLCALYILTGCDYVSAFYRCTKANFVETLIRDASFVCPNGNLLKMIGNEFQQIDQAAWLRLVTAVYYGRFKKFFRSKDIGYTYNVICHHPDSPEAARMLSALHCTGLSTGRTHLTVWHEFIRKVTYHVPKVTKFHELKLLPSYQSLVLHCQRADYVMKLFLSAPFVQSPFLPCFTQFGWHVDNNTVFITWDADPSQDIEEESNSECSDDSEDSASSDSNSDYS